MSKRPSMICSRPVRTLHASQLSSHGSARICAPATAGSNRVSTQPGFAKLLPNWREFSRIFGLPARQQRGTCILYQLVRTAFILSACNAARGSRASVCDVARQNARIVSGNDRASKRSLRLVFPSSESVDTAVAASLIGATVAGSRRRPNSARFVARKSTAENANPGVSASRVVLPRQTAKKCLQNGSSRALAVPVRISRDRRHRSEAELAGDEGERELANSPSAHDWDDHVGNLKEQH